MTDLVRCDWANGSASMAAYHDSEWGVPQHDDRVLFEFVILEGAQAGPLCVYNRLYSSLQ